MTTSQGRRGSRAGRDNNSRFGSGGVMINKGRWAVRGLVPRGLVLGCVVALVAGLTPAWAEPPGEEKVDPKRRPEVAAMGFAAGADRPGQPSKAVKALAAMPDAGVVPRQVAVGTARVAVETAGRSLVRAGRLPAAVGPIDSVEVSRAKVKTSASTRSAPAVAAVEVEALDERAADRAGVQRLIKVTSARAGSAGVQVNYAELGLSGNGGARARLVSLPVCAVTSPERPECRVRTDVGAVNDVQAQTLTAAMVLQPESVLAVTTSAGGSAGDFGATPLSSVGEWSAGGSGGDFSWAMSLPVPGTAGELAPDLSLSYSANAVDGRATSTNNQPSWVGEGWDLGLGHIERKYENCADDMAGENNNTVKTGDQCWVGENATVAFGAHSGELIQDGTSNQWRLRDDDGTRFEKLTAEWDNGDNDKEYWVATTADGTRYYFGQGRAEASGEATNATWTVPVFGNHPGEPCHATTFASSHCAQAWRWNLERIVDTRGNVVIAYYAKETNQYGRNNNQAVSAYTRGGYLSRIDYGLRADNMGATAAARVGFTVAERCLPTSVRRVRR
ncbi:SpvB/TcaC N-terminal domain-containing protein [Propionibacteriaceae bacterium Y1700]|uniref:SpvB/TcaC N-terminal domain-containing protein n=1 Tax=Microlunatus sp. Y1700 TaxID=3418487 RepID=UPI003DA6F63D